MFYNMLMLGSDLKEKRHLSNKGIKFKSINYSMKTHTLIVKSEKSYIKIHIHEILYLKAAGAYTQIICEGKPCITIPKLLKEFESKLTENNFFRISRSFLVNIDHCTKINFNGKTTLELINTECLEVSSPRKKLLKEYFCKSEF